MYRAFCIFVLIFLAQLVLVQLSLFLAQLFLHCLQQLLLLVQPSVARPPCPLGLLLPGAQQGPSHGLQDHFDADQVVSRNNINFNVMHLPARHYSNADEAILLVLHTSLRNECRVSTYRSVRHISFWNDPCVEF